ncbi:hypothetical protein HS088_TW13G01581 [Tripterygium wilfordii]|uniref:Uncharacterized protein n=1 Tax=Tripterygium wilfordii TaxID=458696 RepID=A0A7J7CX75_TRIWF|nr:uncharacterized protein LOC120013021 [Tripterygium wilfordii]KAF5738680.1 hypothetical protein HS088_TW13G01581 [Tripterygium wilfordii]
MGCGESKHDVATGNTVTLKKSDTGSKNCKGTESFIEAASNDKTNTNTSVQNQEREINVGKGTEDGQNVKDITEDTELKGGENKTVASELATFVSKESPNHFFSSRKDEEAIDAEGRSEKSEYCSPRHEDGKESLFNENVEADIAVEEKFIKQPKEETANGEDIKMREENLVKEPEASTAIEAEVSIPEEKNGFSTEKVPYATSV